MNHFNYVLVTIIYCLGVILKVECSGKGVLVSQIKTTWDESTCTLVEPEIICRDDGSCIVENGLDLLTNAEDQDNGFWIGFVKTWISFAYVGCNQLSAGSEYLVSSLGECRRTTGCQTFGIRNSTAGLRCKCASDRKAHRGSCRRTCEEADQYPCGDTSNTTMFSIYTIENVPPSKYSHDKDKNCLLFYYRFENDFFWQPCNLMTTPALLCSDKDFSNQNQTAQPNYSSNKQWAFAIGNCFDGKQYPATIKSIQNAQFTEQNSQNYWTGILKKESIISKSYMLDNSTNLPMTFAYVEQKKQTFYVRFANKSDSRRSLCVGDNDKSRSTSNIVVGVVIAVTLLVAGVLAVMIKRRSKLNACFNNAASDMTSCQPSTGVSTVVGNQQRVEYANTISDNEMHENTENSMEATSYEKLTMTTGDDNYLSIQEFDAVRQDYQNT